MTLHDPFKISPRLLPALQIGDGWVSLEAVGCNDDRLVYRWYIDIPAGEFSEADLESPRDCLQESFGTLLAFLDAAQESYAYGLTTGRETENKDLFPTPVVEWAYQHSSEIESLHCQLQDAVDRLIDENDE